VKVIFSVQIHLLSLACLVPRSDSAPLGLTSSCMKHGTENPTAKFTEWCSETHSLRRRHNTTDESIAKLGSMLCGCGGGCERPAGGAAGDSCISRARAKPPLKRLFNLTNVIADVCGKWLWRKQDRAKRSKVSVPFKWLNIYGCHCCCRGEQFFLFPRDAIELSELDENFWIGCQLLVQHAKEPSLISSQTCRKVRCSGIWKILHFRNLYFCWSVRRERGKGLT